MAYRDLSVTKRVHGKLKRYNSLRQFDAECSKRGGGNACTTVNLRCTKDGGGLATVKTISFKPRLFDPSGRELHPSRVKSRYPDSGTWLLHFGSCQLLKKTLRERTTPAREGMLSGARRRKRR